MLCLGLADKRAASSLLPSCPTQAGGPGRETVEPGLEEQCCFISQVINYDDSNPPPLLPSAYAALPSQPCGRRKLWAQTDQCPLWEQLFPMPNFQTLFLWTEAQWEE